MGEQLDVIDFVGRFGIYHGIVLSVAVLRAIPIAWTYMMSPLMAPDVPHRCAPPPHLNATLWASFADPDKCSAFPLESIFDGSSFHTPSAHATRQLCEFGWNFDTEVFGRTATSEWNLVCNDSWMRSGLQATIMMGSFCGVPIFGKLADALGRKRTFYSGVLIASVFGIAGTFAPSLFWFNICRFFVAGCATGFTAAIVTLFMEIMPKTNRVLMNVGFGLGYVIPLAFVGILSYLLRDFRLMQLALGLSFLLVLPFYPFMHESPKWLLAQGKTPQAMATIRRILQRNKRPIPEMDDIMIRLSAPFRQKQQEQSDKLTFLSLFKSRAILVNLICIHILWFSESITYYHIMLNAHKVPGNPQLNYAIAGSSEIPAALIGIWICRRYGRRISQMAPLVIGSICLLIKLLFIPNEAMWPNLLMSMWIRFLLKSQNFTQWIAIHENFPTPLRSTGFAFCHMFCRVGAAIAPFIVDLGRMTHPLVPHGIFFIFAFIECVCLKILPETLNQPLPDTVEALEDILKKSM